MKCKQTIEEKELALTYHISCQGKTGAKIFMDDEDKAYFINLLKQQKIKNNITFYAYMLLSKQYSCLLETTSNNLSNSMHRINSNYANYFNRRHKRNNKLFKDRYSCFIIDKKKYLVEISCKLHLLAKKDRVLESVFKYKWSSLPGYINKKKREDWINYDCILNLANAKNQKPSLNYQRYIKEALKNQIDSSLKDLKGRIILGSEDFKKEVLKKQHLNKQLPQKKYIAQKIIALVTQSPSWSLLKTNRKKFNLTILSRNAAIYFLKKYTDLSNQQLHAYFKTLKKSSVSQMSRRFNLIMKRHNIIKKISLSLEEDIKNIIGT